MFPNLLIPHAAAHELLDCRSQADESGRQHARLSIATRRAQRLSHRRVKWKYRNGGPDSAVSIVGSRLPVDCYWLDRVPGPGELISCGVSRIGGRCSVAVDFSVSLRIVASWN